MIGVAEVALFLLPFVLFALWRVLAPHASRLALALALAAVAGVALGAAWVARRDRMGWHQPYVPAVTLPDGTIVPGHVGAIVPGHVGVILPGAIVPGHVGVQGRPGAP
ncbi:MAG: hypothetical protein BGP12_08385 [Rhodospirillales bacterium 70-18]|nr:hypothetical protein [Rhodospirillales bacterium]OJY73118.1 MAG: hypothetical protein BGP12_08385 [Rhodospirillales bacterium 70-18]